MSRRHEDCPTCTVEMPTFDDLDVNAFWRGLSWRERTAITISDVVSRSLRRVPGYAAAQERRHLRASACPDCGELYHQVFMVHDFVWSTTGLANDAGWFCLPCFERRLGRAVEEGDLCDVPANDWL
jgi:hypothetical protein